MPQISIIKKSDILKARRFDAEYFKPEYLEDDFSLEKKGYNFLFNISNVKGGKRLPFGESFSDVGIPYIRAEDIKNNFVQYENVPKISYDLHEKLMDYQAKKDDVLFTIVGNSVGDIGIVKFELEKCNLTENAGKITNLKKINPESFFIYMLSKYGQNQIHREKVGTAQPKLALDRIRKFKVPTFPQSFQLQIEKIVKEAHHAQTQSKQLYKEAEEILLKELGLLDFQPAHKLSFEITKKETEQAKRFDSEYFQPKYEEIIDHIESYEEGFYLLGNLIKNYSTGYPFKSETYAKEGCYLIRINNIEKGKLNLENASKIPNEDIHLSEKDIAKENDILISMSGTIGNACRIPKGIEAVINQRIFRFTPQSFNEEVLVLLINSIIGLSQLERIGTGGVQTNISGNDIQKIKIPLIKPQIQKQISHKIQESHKLRKESKQLLEQAKKTVEDEIEK